MKTLHLLRHAKAVQHELYESDFERPLAKRGVAACKALSKHLSATGFTVDHVYCSASQRTRETHALIKDVLGDAKATFSDRLYLIDTADLLRFIAEIPDKVHSAMIIGHNPEFHMAALRLTHGAAEGHAQELETMTKKFPTGALCSLQFDVPHWSDAARGTGTLTGFIRPRDLA